MTWNTPYLGTPRGATYTASGATTVLSGLSVAGHIDANTVDMTGAGNLSSTLSVRGVTTLHAALNSASAISGGALTATTVAGTTGNLSSTLSVRGATTLHAQLDSASAISGGALSATSALFRDRVSIGAGTPIVLVSASSVTLVATTAVATKSTTTTFPDNNAAVGDIVTWGLGTSTSSLSAGLTLDMYVSATSTIQIRLSNVSAANAAQPAISLTYKLERLVW